MREVGWIRRMTREEGRKTDMAAGVWNGQQQGHYGGQRWRGAGCGGETDGDRLKGRICGNRTGGLRSTDTRFHTSPLWLGALKTHTYITQYMIMACGGLWAHAHGCTCTCTRITNNFTGLQCLFCSLFTLLLLCISLGFLLPGGHWPSVSKAFDHGGSMKALPQNLTPMIIWAVPLN